MEEKTELTELQQKIAEYEAQVKNLKNTLSERNSEAANRKREAEEYKKKYEATLSEAELAEQKRKAESEERDAKFNELLRKSNVADYKAKYLAMGYTEELAQSSAEAKVDGNDEVLFKNEATFIQAKTENVKAEMLKTQPTITPGQPPQAEEIQKMRDAKLRQYAGLN